RHRVAAGSHARRHPDRPDRGLLVGVFLGRIQGRLGFRRARPGVDILPDRPAWPARGGEGLMTAASGLAVDNTSKSRDFWAPLLKDAVLAALVAVLLALPLVGLQTYDIGGGALGIRTHFDWVAIGAAAVFAGRFGLRLLPQLRSARLAAGPMPINRLTAWAGRQAIPITLAGIAFAVALPFLPFSSRYLVDLGTTVLIYVMLGWGLNVVVGLAGLLDLGYVAFYAVGAYTFGLLARDLGFSF